MTKSMRALTFLVAVGFAVPALAGQAVPRTTTSGSSSSGSSSSGSSGGGTSSGEGSGSSGASSRSSGSSGPTDASGRQMFSGSEFKSTHSRIPSNNATRTGTAESRRAPAPGGIATGGDAAASSSTRTGADLFQGFGEHGAVGRSRNGAPLTGSAATRPVVIGGGGLNLDYVAFPFYGPWGNWYPWYGGFGWNLGFVAYNPWYYGATRWYWGPYGMWYDPYMYDPFYFGGRYAGGGGGSDYDEVKLRDPKKTTGSLRLKANPSTAAIYIDGALTGRVEELLNDRLELEGGRHTLELRAEGYVTQTQEINVKVDTTQTVRINLKKK